MSSQNCSKQNGTGKPAAESCEPHRHAPRPSHPLGRFSTRVPTWVALPAGTRTRVPGYPGVAGRNAVYTCINTRVPGYPGTGTRVSGYRVFTLTVLQMVTPGYTWSENGSRCGRGWGEFVLAGTPAISSP
eukprot:3464704-Rhodomonas_salina.3